MNLVQFMKKVDAIIGEMTEDQLQSCLHEVARELPENKREDFLELLDRVKEEECYSQVYPDKQYEELHFKIKPFKKLLEYINDGEKCLDSEYNEEWDDWYNSDADEILFSDPDALLPNIEDAIDLLHRCVDMECYKDGCELAEVLSVLEISVTGDYNEYDGSPLILRDLYDSKLLDGRFENVVAESLYLTYMGNELAFRADELYCMMGNYECYEVTLEEIMQMGRKELPEFGEFLPLWIDYLGNQTGRGAKLLLQEAQSMLDDEEQILEIARKNVAQHPELYKQLLQRGLEGQEWDKMLSIGLEALEKIDVTYLLRSEIALLTAEYANRLKNIEAMEFCWVEAFRSDTSVVNYMRARFMVRDWNQYQEKIRKIYEETYNRTKWKKENHSLDYYVNNQPVNLLGHNTYCTLLFWDREYENVIHLGLSEKKALGWSSTFMKEGIALFLLLLYQGKTLHQGITSMLKLAISGCGFQKDKFLKSISLDRTETEQELFWRLFCEWKTEIDISESKCMDWLKMIEKYVQVRTERIMNANRRNYYGECAAFIAAYGEVLESRGMTGSKADIMAEYKSSYPRRRAFHQELRDYGM